MFCVDMRSGLGYFHNSKRDLMFYQSPISTQSSQPFQTIFNNQQQNLTPTNNLYHRHYSILHLPGLPRNIESHLFICSDLPPLLWLSVRNLGQMFSGS